MNDTMRENQDSLKRYAELEYRIRELNLIRERVPDEAGKAACDRRIRFLKREQNYILERIDQVEGRMLQLILTMRYCAGSSWKEIHSDLCSIFGYFTERTLYRLHRKALLSIHF